MTNAASMKRRYLALWFPFLPIDRLRSAPEEQPGKLRETASGLPFALVCKIGGALRLKAVDAAGRAMGLYPGMALVDARAVKPDLVVANMDEAADRHCLQKLARRCFAWSPLVTQTPPDRIVLDIAGIDHLFGGETGLMARIMETMVSIGMTVRLAAASTPEAAQALVRYAPLPIEDERKAIRALPIAALDLDDVANTALCRAGLKTLGHVAARSSASIAARFGMEAVTALRRITGEELAPITALISHAPLYFERRFDEPITLHGAVAACFSDLLDEAVRVLEQHDLGGRRFSLALFRSDGARHKLAIETGLPTRDPAMVMRLFDQRIATLVHPLDPGFGYDRMSLFLPITEPLVASQSALDGSEQGVTALAELIDTLSLRLGSQGFVRLCPQDRHLPEKAQLMLPAIETRAPICWPTPPEGEPPMRPLFLFDPPQPVDVIAQVPDGPPHRFCWRRKLHEVRLYEGPERIASEWWRRKGGEHAGQGGLTRDYYRIEDARGRRYWIFRHGLYAEKPDPRWYLHGLFA